MLSISCLALCGRVAASRLHLTTLVRFLWSLTQSQGTPGIVSPCHSDAFLHPRNATLKPKSACREGEDGTNPVLGRISFIAGTTSSHGNLRGGPKVIIVSFSIPRRQLAHVMSGRHSLLATRLLLSQNVSHGPSFVSPSPPSSSGKGGMGEKNPGRLTGHPYNGSVSWLREQHRRNNRILPPVCRGGSRWTTPRETQTRSSSALCHRVSCWLGRGSHHHHRVDG